MKNLNLEAIKIKYNNKLFPALVELFNSYIEAYVVKYGDVKIPSTKTQDEMMKFSYDFLNIKIIGIIKQYLGLTLTGIEIGSSLLPNAFCIYSLPQYVKSLSTTDRNKIKTEMLLATNKVETLISDDITTNLTEIYPDMTFILRIDLGLLIAPTLYVNKTVMPFKAEHIAFIILHEIGHFFYCFDYTTRTNTLMEMLDNCIYGSTKTVLENYDETITKLSELSMSIVKLNKLFKSGQYTKTLKYVKGLDEKFLNKIAINIEKTVSEYTNFKSENVPFDAKKATYFVILYSNSVNQYWKNILYRYWYVRVMPPSQQSVNMIKDDERSADDFAVRNGAGKYGFEAMYILNKLWFDPNVLETAQTYDFRNINRIKLSSRMLSQLDYLYNTYLFEDGGLYDSPINRLERLIKQNYAVLSDNTISKKVRESLVQDITSARDILDGIKKNYNYKKIKAHKESMERLNRYIGYNFTSMKKVLTEDYALLQNITVDFMSSEFNYQRDKLGRMMNL